MLQCGKAAAYMGTFSRDSGTLDMPSSYATHSLAIRRLRWLYAGNTLVIRYSYDTHRFNTVSIQTILYFQRLYVRIKINFGIFIRNLYVPLICSSVTGPGNTVILL